MAADPTAIAYFAPIAAFLIVFLVVYAILAKTKLFEESKWFNIFLSLFIATIFVSAGGAIKYIGAIVPWFAVLLVSLAFLLAFTGFVGKPAMDMNKGIGIAFVIILGLVFIISGFIIFSSAIFPYLPGPGFGSGDNLETTIFLDWLYSPRVAGAILLIIISALVSWVLVKSK
ncbi:MAG: hypothetical protein ABIG28_03700 [archaeon]